MTGRNDPAMSDSVPTIAAMRRWARAQLRAAGIDTAALDADILLAHALGLSRERLLLRDPARPVAAPARAAFQDLIMARVQRVPVAYLVGEREFFGYRFGVGPGVLVPRPETETLVTLALGMGPSGPARLLDLGTGSGAILLSLLAERPDWRGIGVDRAPAAAAWARKNAVAVGVAERARIVVSDWDEALNPALRFDLVLANPPYVRRDEIPELAPEIARHEPRMALDGGPDGLAGLRAVLKAACRRLMPGGRLFVEIGADQGGAAVALARAAGLDEVHVHADLSHRPRVVTGRWPGSSRANLTCNPLLTDGLAKKSLENG